MPGFHWSRSLAPGPASRWANERITPSTCDDRLLVAVAELAHRLVQRGGQRPAQRLVGARLELAGAPAAADRGRAQRVEEHRLADAAQPGQDQRALRPLGGHAGEHDVERRELLVAAGELGRSLPGAGRVGFRIGSTIGPYRRV